MYLAPSRVPVMTPDWPPERRLHTALWKTGLHWHLFMMTCQLRVLLCGIAASTLWVDGLKRSQLLVTLLRFPLGAHDLRVVFSGS
jgi:hypothetical protein